MFKRLKQSLGHAYDMTDQVLATGANVASVGNITSNSWVETAEIETHLDKLETLADLITQVDNSIYLSKEMKDKMRTLIQAKFI